MPVVKVSLSGIPFATWHTGTPHVRVGSSRQQTCEIAFHRRKIIANRDQQEVVI